MTRYRSRAWRRRSSPPRTSRSESRRCCAGSIDDSTEHRRVRAAARVHYMDYLSVPLAMSYAHIIRCPFADARFRIRPHPRIKLQYTLYVTPILGKMDHRAVAQSATRAQARGGALMHAPSLRLGNQGQRRFVRGASRFLRDSTRFYL